MLRYCGIALLVTLLLASSVRCRVADDLVTMQPVSSEATAVKDTFLCKVCGIFWKVVDDVLGDQKVDDWLTQYVEDKICPKLPTEEAQEECVEKAPQFVPAIIHWVEGLANGAMCTDAGVCGNDVQLVAPMGMDQQEDEACQICKNLTLFVEAEAQKVKPETLVEKIEELKDECDRIGGNEAEQCKELVDKYGYMLVYFIEKEKKVDIEKACSDLGICSTPSSAPVIDPLPASLVRQMAEYAATASNDESDCNRCKAIAAAAHEDVANPETQEAVIAYLSRACAWVPVYTEQCNEAVGNYTIQALDTLAVHINPDEVCDYLGICAEESLALSETDIGEVQKVVEPVYIQ